MFCLVLLEDAFFLLPLDTPAAIECEEEEVLNLDALWEGITRTKTEVALTLNMDDDCNLVVSSLSGFIVGVGCV